MTDDPRSRADARLAAALGASDAPADPRPYYRPVLRHLKDRDPAAFARAVAHLEERLIPEVAAGAEPLGAWLDYGRHLAAALGPGRTVEVDPTGRARPLEDGTGEAGLVLHVPAADDAPVLVLRHPRAASPAQTATVDLLVMGRVTATAYR